MYSYSTEQHKFDRCIRKRKGNLSGFTSTQNGIRNEMQLNRNEKLKTFEALKKVNLRKSKRRIYENSFSYS